jgi:P-type conjugative transfer protein TrbJ
MAKKPWLAVTAATAVLVLSASGPASAFVVFDPSNYAQNVMTAARALQQINNQITMLQNQAQMLLNQGRNLTSLNFSALSELRSNLARTEALIAQAKGLAFDVANLDQKFRQLYPAGPPTGVSGAALTTQAQGRWSASLEALRTAMTVQADISGQVEADQTTLGEISGRSAQAVGVLQAVQATNELLALQAKQLMQGQALALSADRAAASEAARALSADSRAQAVRAQFTGTPQAYQPLPVQVFGDGR